MRKLQALLLIGVLWVSGSAQAFWGNSWGGWNPWPVWTPMYWMEEFVGDDYDNYGSYGYGPYGGGYPGGYPGGYGAPAYGGAPYRGYGAYPYSLYPYGYTYTP